MTEAYREALQRCRPALYDIIDAQIDEVSLVDKGDNPPAKAVFWKRAPEDEKEVSKLSTASGAAQEIKARAEQIALREGVDMADAIARAMKENPGVVAKYRELRDEPEEEVEDPYARAERIEIAKMERAPATYEFLSYTVEGIRKRHPDMSEGEVWAEAARRDPALYEKARLEGMS